MESPSDSKLTCTVALKSTSFDLKITSGISSHATQLNCPSLRYPSHLLVTVVSINFVFIFTCFSLSVNNLHVIFDVATSYYIISRQEAWRIGPQHAFSHDANAIQFTHTTLYPRLYCKGKGSSFIFCRIISFYVLCPPARGRATVIVFDSS